MCLGDSILILHQVYIRSETRLVEPLNIFQLIYAFRPC